MENSWKMSHRNWLNARPVHQMVLDTKGSLTTNIEATGTGCRIAAFAVDSGELCLSGHDTGGKVEGYVFMVHTFSLFYTLVSQNNTLIFSNI